MSQLFTSGGQSIGVSVSTSVLPVNTQDWSPLGWTGWISLQFKTLKSLLQHHSSKASILQRSAFFIDQLSHPYILITGRIWIQILHQPSVWLLALAHMLLTHFVHPLIMPPKFSHYIIFSCCSLYWKCLSNSSLKAGFICNFIVDHRCQYFCEVFSYCIR